MRRKIVLVRHGRSAHVHAGWMNLAAFLRWREAYEAAGIDVRETAPRELRSVASAAGVIVSSDIPRAIESARLLAPQANVVTSPLLRELALVPPNLRGVRLPLLGWALSFGVRMLISGRAYVTAEEQERAREAAHWLASLADERGVVLVVTHATFRSVLAKVLQSEGWQRTVPRRRSAHWSAWSFVRGYQSGPVENLSDPARGDQALSG